MRTLKQATRATIVLVIVLQACVITYLAPYLWWEPDRTFVYLLPDGFEGMAAIAFRRGTGVTIDPDPRGTRVYRIPEGGVLNVDGEPSTDWHFPAVFYEKQDGSLEYVPSQRSDGELHVSGQGRTVLSYDNLGRRVYPTVPVDVFYVGRKSVGLAFLEDELRERILKKDP